MTRFLIALAVASGGLRPAAAHFYYLVPTADGADVVFADGPAGDGRVGPDVFAELAFSSADGSPAPVAAADGKAKVTAAGPVVYGSVPYGVVLRGDPHPVLLMYHAKAVRGPVGSAAPVGLPLELTPVAAGGGLAFAATADGQPAAGLDVVVHTPDADKPVVLKTDAAGRTPPLTRPGAYAARTYRPVPTAGEHLGRRYGAVRHYATVTAKLD